MVIWQHLCLAQVLSFSKKQWSSWCKSGPDFCGPGSALATPPSQELRGRAAVYLHSEVASGLYMPDSKERPQQRPVSFYRHSLKASARKKACVPNPPPTHSSLTTGRLRCSSFRRIQSFNSTRRLEAEYTRKGTEEHHIYGVHRKQTKPGLLPLPPGRDEGRRATGRADSSHRLPEDAARHEENKGSGEWPRMHPRKGTPLPCSRRVPGCRGAPRPPPAPRCPPTQLRQGVGVREATCEGRRAATSQRPARGEAPAPRWAPASRTPPGRCRSGARPRPRPRSRREGRGPGRPPPAPGSR